MLLFLVDIILRSSWVTEDFFLPEIIEGDILGQYKKASVSQVSIHQTMNSELRVLISLKIKQVHSTVLSFLWQTA